MIKVEDAMQKNVITIKNDMKIEEAARILRENKISGAPVIDKKNRLVGMLSEGDIIRLLEVHSPKLNLILPSPLDLIELPIRMKHEYDEIVKGIKKASLTLVDEIMTRKLITVKPDQSISDAAELMDKHKIKRLPVVDDEGNLIGIITRGDIIGALVKT
ncbi:CBS domain-containing protein [Methanothermobacter tenebrarum]|uniref:CBS domain-containing protein n=1 Tax=Methanothermobacter tenebrarum TaxID=680118 RepID=UPI0015EC2D80|nr:CBS domain-containing protein [Methanothermobacter tenebrarum]MBC7100017.1 CBS domain-containing protein [Methanobacteriales archaeon]MBC7117797.1 CBS domain-containing protein [Methanobacteriaceae archaeon]